MELFIRIAFSIAFLINVFACWAGEPATWVGTLTSLGVLTFLVWTMDFDDDDDIIL